MQYVLTTPSPGEPGSGTVYRLSIDSLLAGHRPHSVTVIPGDTIREVVVMCPALGSDAEAMEVARALISECGGTEFTPSPEGVRAFRRRAAMICFESYLRGFASDDLDPSDAIEATKRVMAVEPVIGS